MPNGRDSLNKPKRDQGSIGQKMDPLAKGSQLETLAISRYAGPGLPCRSEAFPESSAQLLEVLGLE